MPNLTAEQLALTLVFVVPGFVALRVYDLFVPGQFRDSGKSLLDAVSYSMLNLAV